MRTFLGTSKSKAQAKEIAKANWKIWRLITHPDSSITFSDILVMDLDDIEEANGALDYHEELVKKAKEKNKIKGR